MNDKLRYSKNSTIDLRKRLKNLRAKLGLKIRQLKRELASLEAQEKTSGQFLSTETQSQIASSTASGTSSSEATAST